MLWQPIRVVAKALEFGVVSVEPSALSTTALAGGRYLSYLHAPIWVVQHKRVVLVKLLMFRQRLVVPGGTLQPGQCVSVQLGCRAT